MYYRALGGLGDFMQMASSAVAAKEIILISHSESGVEFFEALGVKTIAELNFNSLEELSAVHNLGTNLDRDYFDPLSFSIAFTKTAYLVKDHRQLDVAIHPFGSAFSKYVDKIQNNKGKDFPIEFLNNLIESIPQKYSVQILGSPIQLVNLAPHINNIKRCIIKPTTIWEAMYITHYAARFIGADSFLKTSRAISRRDKERSITLVENKVDIFRDTHFIDPYKDNSMSFIPFNDLNNQIEANIIISNIKEQLWG
jgi:hypothetical protein